jgi:hypothetical protein
VHGPRRDVRGLVLPRLLQSGDEYYALHRASSFGEGLSARTQRIWIRLRRFLRRPVTACERYLRPALVASARGLHPSLDASS